MKPVTARALIVFMTTLAYVRITIFAIAGLALAYWESEPLLRPDPTPEALSAVSGVLLETPRAGCSDTVSAKKSREFLAALQTANGTLDMVLPCYGDVDRRALGKTLTVRYEKGTDFVGRPYEVVWEMRTPAHVYLDFARSLEVQHRSRWTGALWVFCGLAVTWCALRPRWLKRFLLP